MLVDFTILFAAASALVSVNAAPAAVPIQARACVNTLRSLEWTAVDGLAGPQDREITGTTDFRLEAYGGDAPWLGAFTANLHGIGSYDVS